MDFDNLPLSRRAKNALVFYQSEHDFDTLPELVMSLMGSTRYERHEDYWHYGRYYNTADFLKLGRAPGCGAGTIREIREWAISEAIKILSEIKSSTQKRPYYKNWSIP